MMMQNTYLFKLKIFSLIILLIEKGLGILGIAGTQAYLAISGFYKVIVSSTPNVLLDYSPNVLLGDSLLRKNILLKIL